MALGFDGESGRSYGQRRQVGEQIPVPRYNTIRYYLYISILLLLHTVDYTILGLFGFAQSHTAQERPQFLIWAMSCGRWSEMKVPERPQRVRNWMWSRGGMNESFI